MLEGNRERLCICCGCTYELTRQEASTVFCGDCSSQLSEHEKSHYAILWAGARIRSGTDATIELGQQINDRWPEGFPVKRALR